MRKLRAGAAILLIVVPTLMFGGMAAAVEDPAPPATDDLEQPEPTPTPAGDPAGQASEDKPQGLLRSFELIAFIFVAGIVAVLLMPDKKRRRARSTPSGELDPATLDSPAPAPGPPGPS